MRFIRWMAVSLSLYSRIPIPGFEWKEGDYEHSLVFFPLIGVLIGAVSYAAFRAVTFFELPLFCKCIIMTLIPVIMTGGFHLDGFMDTTDALRSYKSPEEKRMILKDPHSGAFAVIGLVVIVLINACCFGVILDRGDEAAVMLMCLVYVVSRSLSGLTSVLMKHSSDAGMLHEETKGRPKSVITALILWGVAALTISVLISWICGCTIILLSGISVLLYRHMAMREFGGVSGDTAGYYLSVYETASCVLLAVLCLI